MMVSIGFTKTNRTSDVLAELTERIRLGINGKFNASFFVDLNKAFDTLDHKIPLRKLDCYGIHGSCFTRLQNCLSNRYQCVQVNNQTSDWLPINIALHQGSVLDPLLFLIYIIDLQISATVANVFLYADDTNVACKSSCLDLFQKY